MFRADEIASPRRNAFQAPALQLSNCALNRLAKAAKLKGREEGRGYNLIFAIRHCCIRRRVVIRTIQVAS
jgi:hypothetical protein